MCHGLNVYQWMRTLTTADVDCIFQYCSVLLKPDGHMLAISLQQFLINGGQGNKLMSWHEMSVQHMGRY